MVRLEAGICLTDYFNNFLKGWIEGRIRRGSDGTFQTVLYQCGRDGCTRTCWLEETVENGIVTNAALSPSGGSNCTKYT